MTSQLFPKPPKRMRQPTKEQLRDQVATVTEDNIRLRAEIDHLRRPWWRRLFQRKAA